MVSDFERYSAHYEELTTDPVKSWIGGDGSRYFLQLKSDELCKHVQRLGLDPSKASALDVGCGTGMVAQMLDGKFAELHGVDSSRGMIHEARERRLPHVRFRTNDSERLPFQDNRFDLVYSMSLLHHVLPEKRADVISEMTRVLKPGGWMINFEHNAWNPVTCRIVRRCPLDQGVTLLTAGETARLYRSEKLCNIHTRFILFFPEGLAFRKALEPLLYWLPIGGQFYSCGQKRGNP